MANNSQDSVYGRRPWNSLPEMLVDDSLDRNTRPAADVALTRPPIPNIGKTPPRFGYSKHTLGIRDIAHVEDIYPRIDFTGQQSGYSGTMTPALGVM